DPVEVDKTALNKAIEEAKKAETEGKTEELVKAFEEALAEAKKVEEKKDATKAEVEKATKALEDAITNLKDEEAEENTVNFKDLPSHGINDKDPQRILIANFLVTDLDEKGTSYELIIEGEEPIPFRQSSANAERYNASVKPATGITKEQILDAKVKIIK